MTTIHYFEQIQKLRHQQYHVNVVQELLLIIFFQMMRVLLLLLQLGMSSLVQLALHLLEVQELLDQHKVNLQVTNLQY
jgi:hypothetical protein